MRSSGRTSAVVDELPASEVVGRWPRTTLLNFYIGSGTDFIILPAEGTGLGRQRIGLPKNAGGDTQPTYAQS